MIRQPLKSTPIPYTTLLRSSVRNRCLKRREVMDYELSFNLIGSRVLATRSTRGELGERLEATASECRRLQAAASDCRRWQATAGDCKRLQATASDCKRLQAT